MQAYKAISAVVEEARAQERARIRALVQGLLTETIARYYMDEIPESQYDEGVTVGLSKVLALIDKEGTSHE
jgi:N-methylhydantoinase B/oxoprolinase/acetone carboxylase alpha subunit